MSIAEELAAVIERETAEYDKRLVYYNRETGEVFDTRSAAIADAGEQYDFGDPTNIITYLGFPNDELPYIEVEWGKLKHAFELFG